MVVTAKHPGYIGVVLFYLLPDKIHRLEFTCAMFARKAIERDAPVSQNFLHTKSSFFAAFAGHNFGAKGNRHFRSRPDARRHSVFSIEQTHLSLLSFPLFCALSCAAPDSLSYPV